VFVYKPENTLMVHLHGTDAALDMPLLYNCTIQRTAKHFTISYLMLSTAGTENQNLKTE